MNDYIITTDPGEHHQLKISWNGDHSLVYITTNFRTIGLSPAMAIEIRKGLMALEAGFERAISENALQLEIEDLNYRNRPHYEPPRSGTRQDPPPKPTLDLL